MGHRRSGGRAPGSHEFSVAPFSLHQMHPTPHHPICVCFPGIAGRGGFRRDQALGCQAHPNLQPQPPILDSLSLEEKVRGWGNLVPPLFPKVPPALIAAIRPISLLAFHGNQMFSTSLVGV